MKPGAQCAIPVTPPVVLVELRTDNTEQASNRTEGFDCVAKNVEGRLVRCPLGVDTVPPPFELPQPMVPLLLE